MSRETEQLVEYVIRSGEKYLLFKNSDGEWSFLSDEVKKDEEPEDALRRIIEEIGAKGEVVRSGESYSRGRDEVHPFLVEVDEAEPEPSDGQWFTTLEVAELENLGSLTAVEKLDLVNGEVALVIVEEAGKYLVLKRSEQKSSPGYWTFVSGRVEEDETVEEAAVREVKEEAGLEGEIVKHGDPYISQGELGFWQLHPILMKADSRDVELNWEHSEYRWVSLDEVKGLKTLGDMKAPERLDISE